MNLPYELKKLAMKPYTAWRRWRQGEQDPFMKAALELHYYRPAFYRFIGAFLQNRHILHEAALTENSVALDVGAYRGDWSREIFERYGCGIYAFEPNPETFRELEAATENRWQNLPYGLSDRTEEVRFSLKGMGSSAFNRGNEEDKLAHTPAQLKAVDQAWGDLGLEQVDLMKINIEGGEFPLLERMEETGLLAMVDTYLIQFHEWYPGAYRRRRRIRHALAKTHQLVWDYHFVWERWERKPVTG